MQRRHDAGGFTLTELLFSTVIASGLLAVTYTAMSSGQAAFSISEAVLQAQQAARNAIDAVGRDLADAQIYAFSHGGTGKSYVKFRRPDPNLVDGSDKDADGATDDPLWQFDTVKGIPAFMYAWCPGAALTQDPCRQILPDIGGPTDVATGPLVFARAGRPPQAPDNPASNRLADSSQPWTRIRVVAQNVTSFEIRFWNALGTEITQSTDDCGQPSPLSLGPSERCVNQTFLRPLYTYSPPQSPPYRVFNGVPVMATIRLTVSGRGGLGRSATSQVQGRIYLTNTQN